MQEELAKLSKIFFIVLNQIWGVKTLCQAITLEPRHAPGPAYSGPEDPVEMGQISAIVSGRPILVIVLQLQREKSRTIASIPVIIVVSEIILTKCT